MRFLLTTLDIWKSRGIGRDFFYIETIPRDRDRQRSTKIEDRQAEAGIGGQRGKTGRRQVKAGTWQQREKTGRW